MSQQTGPRRTPAADVRPGLWATAAAVALMAALSAWAWTRIPAGARVPIHWDVSGHPDRWAGRLEALAVGPLTAVGMAALLWLVTRIDPRRGHLARSARTYNAIWISVLVMVTVSHAVAVLAATGRHVAVGPAVTAAVGVMLLVIGNYLPKLRSSWFAGVRTPWTLSSELSWHRTHRLAGRLLAALGLLVLASALLLGGDGQTAVLVGGLAVVLAVLVPYSWWVWRSDPGRQTIGRA